MATKTPLVPHLVDGKYIVDMPDVYNKISSICGIEKLVGEPPADAVTQTLRQVITTGIIRRATARLDNKKTRDIYMTAANCTKVGALAGQDYASGVTIKKAHFKQQIRLG
jgi:ABC-type xylose transport system substrate-binding protein